MSFNPNLQSMPEPERVVAPTEDRSAGQNYALIGNIFEAFAPRPQTEAGARRATENAAMQTYSQGLDSLQQQYEAGAIDNRAYRTGIANLQTAIARDYNVDPQSGAFASITSTVTGLESEQARFTPEQMDFNSLASTPEGVAQLTLAAQELGIEDIQDPAVVNSAMNRVRERAIVDNLNITNEREWLQAKPQIIGDLDRRIQELEISRQLMEDNGIALTNQMVQETYRSIESYKRMLFTQVPTEFRTDEDFAATVQTLDSILVEMDDLVNNVLGGQGEFDVLTPMQAQLADRVLAISQAAMGPTPNPAVVEFAGRLGLTSGMSNVDPVLLNDLLQDLNTQFVELTVQQPDWAREAGFLQSNNVIDIATAIAVGTDERTYIENLTSSYRERLGVPTGLDASERVAEFERTFSAVESFNFNLTGVSQTERDRAINVAGNAASNLIYLTAENTDYLSASRLSSIGATLLNAVENIQVFNPSAADEIRTVVYAGLAGMRANIDMMLSDQSDYILTEDNKIQLPSAADAGLTGVAAQNREEAIRLINEYYQGDLYRAFADDFASIEGQLVPEEAVAASGGQEFVGLSMSMLRSEIGFREGTLETIAEAVRARYNIFALEDQFRPQFMEARLEELRSAAEFLRPDLAAPTTPEAQAIPPAEAGSFTVPEQVSTDTEFLSAVNSVVSTLQDRGANITENDLLQIISFETAGSFSPSIRASTSSATGLIQFLDSTAEGLGTTTDALASMSRAEQMAYVQRYLEPYAGRINNFGDLYMAIHWPAGIGQADDYVMYREGTDAYTANRGLDSNGDGTVTRGETLNRVFEVTGATPTGTAAPTLTEGELPQTPQATEPLQLSDFIPEVQSLFTSANVDPAQVTAVANEQELQRLIANGTLQSGDRVLVGNDLEAYLVEIN